jgi:hypothetical protein
MTRRSVALMAAAVLLACSPATKQIVGEHNLPSLIEQFDPDILAEVLQLDLRSRTAVEAPDFV